MTKIVLSKGLGKPLIKFEVILTILEKIVSILNSRPIIYVFNEPSEPSLLSPAYFLTEKRLNLTHHTDPIDTAKITSTKKNDTQMIFIHR